MNVKWGFAAICALLTMKGDAIGSIPTSPDPFVLRVFPCLEEVEADFAAAPQGTLDTA